MASHSKLQLCKYVCSVRAKNYIGALANSSMTPLHVEEKNIPRLNLYKFIVNLSLIRIEINN